MPKMDAQQASKAAKDYFLDIHGSFGVWHFEIDETDPQQDGSWIVQCSFRPNPNASQRYKYRVAVTEEGTIGKAQRLEPSTRSS